MLWHNMRCHKFLWRYVWILNTMHLGQRIRIVSGFEGHETALSFAIATSIFIFKHVDVLPCVMTILLQPFLYIWFEEMCMDAAQEDLQRVHTLVTLEQD